MTAPRDWDERADDLSVEAIGAGEPTAWFDRLYAEGAAGTIGMPWGRDAPQRELVPWLDAFERSIRTAGRAVVVGCGLGADAEHLAARGWDVVAFDVAPTAIAQARARHPGSSVAYRVADLLALDDDLVGAFDLVVEVFTVQALPDPPRRQAAAAIASLVAPGGTLVAVAFRHTGQPGQPEPDRPPYPLRRDDLDLLAVDGIRLVRADQVGERWVATYER